MVQRTERPIEVTDQYEKRSPFSCGPTQIRVLCLPVGEVQNPQDMSARALLHRPVTECSQ
jgi:hypothetical protein